VVTYVLCVLAQVEGMTLTSYSPGGIIYYSSNGKMPTNDTASVGSFSNRYSAAIDVQAIGTYTARVQFAGLWSTSTVQKYSVKVIAPAIIISGERTSYGTYIESATVGISRGIGSTAYYTTDGTSPKEKKGSRIEYQDSYAEKRYGQFTVKVRRRLL
jgi:hypothetical protein